MTFGKSGFSLLCVAALVIALGSSSGQTRAALVILHANVVDVQDGRILPNSEITITGNVITAVTPNGTAPRDARHVASSSPAAIERYDGQPTGKTPTNDPSIFIAIQDLGLKLDPRRAPVEMLFIDGAEIPDAN
jgi:hypothetical protein